MVCSFLKTSSGISTDADPSSGIDSFAIINLRDVSTKPNYYCIHDANVQGTYYKELKQR